MSRCIKALNMPKFKSNAVPMLLDHRSDVDGHKRGAAASSLATNGPKTVRQNRASGVTLLATVLLFLAVIFLDAGEAASQTRNLDDSLSYYPNPNLSPPKWPEAHPEATYKPEMTPRQYWQHLCKLEAGEFIHRKVEDVDGIYQIRPLVLPSESMLQDRYRLENPVDAKRFAWGALHMPPYDPEDRIYRVGKSYYEMSLSTAIKSLRNGLVVAEYDPGTYYPERDYKFLEQPNVGMGKMGTSPYLRTIRDPRMRLVEMVAKFPGSTKLYPRWEHTELVTAEASRLKARYGFTWRGISRSPLDRRLGIAGQEFVVIDLETNEILGVRRTFILTTPEPLLPSWDIGAQCFGLSSQIEYRNFLHRVLVPSKRNHIEE